jgi:Copper amine oxidase N-terminal domain
MNEIVATIIVAFLTLPQAKLSSPKISVEVDGKALTFADNAPMIYRGRVMVPMRGIFEAIGAYVEYDPASHIITAKRGNEDVELKLGSQIARKNGAEILLEVRPQVIRATTMIPLRFVAESLGAGVTFDEANKVVRIVTTSKDESTERQD